MESELHGERDTVATTVDLQHLDAHVLMELYHFVGIFDKSVGQLGDVDEPILMDTDVDKGTKVGNVGYDSRQFHACYKVFRGLDVRVELERLYLVARVKWKSRSTLTLLAKRVKVERLFHSAAASGLRSRCIMMNVASGSRPNSRAACARVRRRGL